MAKVLGRLLRAPFKVVRDGTMDGLGRWHLHGIRVLCKSAVVFGAASLRTRAHSCSCIRAAERVRCEPTPGAPGASHAASTRSRNVPAVRRPSRKPASAVLTSASASPLTASKSFVARSVCLRAAKEVRGSITGRSWR